MPLNHSSLEADLALMRGMLKQMAADGDPIGPAEAVTDLAALIAERAGASCLEVERRLCSMLAEEGLLGDSLQ